MSLSAAHPHMHTARWICAVRQTQSTSKGKGHLHHVHQFRIALTRLVVSEAAGLGAAWVMHLTLAALSWPETPPLGEGSQ